MIKFSIDILYILQEKGKIYHIFVMNSKPILALAKDADSRSINMTEN